MKKIIIKIDVDKISKDKIKTRTFKNKENEEVSKREMEFDVVPLKEKKFISQGEGWKLWKTHFVAEPTAKDEESNFVGDGIQFERDEDEAQSNYDAIPSKSEDDINPDDIPF